MTAVPPRPAAPDRGAWVCERCGKAPEQHAAGGDAGGCVYAPAFVIHHPATPDATAGDGLREGMIEQPRPATGEVERVAGEMADAVLALPALRDVLAAAARDGDAVTRVRELHSPLDRGTGPQCQGCATPVTFTRWPCATIRALDPS